MDGNGKTLVLKAFAPTRRCETNGVLKLLKLVRLVAVERVGHASDAALVTPATSYTRGDSLNRLNIEIYRGAIS